jgi:imidazolonepropionase-like amidohydrolase
LYLPVTAQYYLTHINVIDVEKGNILTDQTIYVEGNTIKSISSQATANPIGTVYDCSGKQELINLHQAGLTNLQVLQTATISPARFLYRENDLGTVTSGKLADLLILEENPLLDISNTQKISAVVVNG